MDSADEPRKEHSEGTKHHWITDAQLNLISGVLAVPAALLVFLANVWWSLHPKTATWFLFAFVILLLTELQLNWRHRYNRRPELNYGFILIAAASWIFCLYLAGCKTRASNARTKP
jgi:membrane protein YdbS with pleckstrin-like domain